MLAIETSSNSYFDINNGPCFAQLPRNSNDQCFVFIFYRGQYTISICYFLIVFELEVEAIRKPSILMRLEEY